jgi:transposase
MKRLTDMAIGKRKLKQDELFIPTNQLAVGPAHPFYVKLNEVLAEAGFDAFTEKLCAPYYKDGGRPGIPPGTYFRMLFIGYFEGIDSQRGIAWRCGDSLSLRNFLGVRWTEATPVHASMTIIRQRLPGKVFGKVFLFALKLLQQKGVLRGKTIALDATTLEANAAMKSIVRKDNGQDWKEYLRALAKAEGLEDPTDEDLRRLDRKRHGKKVSNDDWESPTDPDARIAKMKDGRTHLAYKAEHAVDLDSEAIVAATVTYADKGDADSAPATLQLAEVNLALAGSETKIAQAVADKGYHDNALITEVALQGIRTYIPEKKIQNRTWTDKPAEYEKHFRANRRRVRGDKGRRLNRLRSEKCERSFAHVCETGGGRRMWVRGQANASKLHEMRCAAYNLGLLLRKVLGLSKPRSWESLKAANLLSCSALMAAAAAIICAATNQPATTSFVLLLTATAILVARTLLKCQRKHHFLTGC